MRKIWYHLKNWFADMSEAFTDQINKCVLSSTAIQTFFYIVFAAILVGSMAGSVEVVRSLAALILVFFASLFVGISIRNVAETKAMYKRIQEIEKGFENGLKYSLFRPLPTICLGDENGVNLPVDFISITVEWKDGADLWEFNEKDDAVSEFFCTVSDPFLCFESVNVTEGDFLKKEKLEWEWIDAGLSGGVCGGGHLGIDD